MPRPERSAARAPRAVLAAVAALLLFAGCGGEDPEPSATPSLPAGHAGVASPSGTATAFNPCDAVDADAVSAALGSPLRLERGTATNVRCSLLPAEEGKPTFELSYLWFDDGLAAAWETMEIPAGQVRTPRIPGADDARIVVNESAEAYAVSAFLQNGTLIQTVNALALAPYDGPRVDRAVETLLTQLSAGRQGT